MANNVFANGRELSCKSGSGKSIACLPDVCMTPPENPATPPGVPVPYPNTGSTSDCTSGSTTVKISKKEASLKNKSYFKKSMGDEAGSAAKKGVVSSKNRGKVYFTAWSMDVKIEGENAVRHLDMTTHNHGSPTNTGPWIFTDTAAIIMAGGQDPCADEKAREAKACEGVDPQVACSLSGLGGTVTESGMRGTSNVRISSSGLVDPTGLPIMVPKSGAKADHERDDLQKPMESWTRAQQDDCLATMRCRLSPKDPKTCCEGQTPHHLVDDTFAKSASGTTYSYNDAPCICAEGDSNTKGSHGMLHAYTKQNIIDRHGKVTDVSENYGQLKTEAAQTVNKVFPTSCCSEECLKAQIDAYYTKNGFNDATPMTGKVSGRAETHRDPQIAWNESRQAFAATQRAARIARLS